MTGTGIGWTGGEKKMKEILPVIGVVVGAVLLLGGLIWLAFRQRAAFFAALLGVGGLLLLNATAAWTGVSGGNSLFSGLLGAVLGLPGLAVLLFLRLL